MVRLHPLVGICSLVAGAALLPALSLTRLAAASLALLAACALAGAGARCLRGVLRLRWLLAALFLVYLADTPGEPLIAALPGFSREGLVGALRRALVLVDIVGAVALLLQHATPRELASGLLTGLGPLQRLGLPTARPAVRFALTLAATETLVTRVSGLAPAGPIRACAGLIREIEAGTLPEAEVAPLPPLPAPPAWQWLLPLTLGALLWAAGG